MTEVSILGINIKKLRELKGWSAYKLSKEAKVGTTTLSEIESGKRQSLNSSTLEKIALALGVEPTDLLTAPDQGEFPVSDIFQTIHTILSSADLVLLDEELSGAEKEFIKSRLDNTLNELISIRMMLKLAGIDKNKIKNAKELIDYRNKIAHGVIKE